MTSIFLSVEHTIMTHVKNDQGVQPYVARDVSGSTSNTLFSPRFPRGRYK